MAPPFSLRFLPKKEEKFTVVYLVRSFRTNARIRFITTGTFNLVVKDRIAFRLSGAPSGLDGLACLGEPKSKSGCPRNSTNIQSAQNPVNPRIPQYFHAISTLGKAAGAGGWGAKLAQERATVWPSAWDYKPDLIGAGLSAHAKAEDRKLRKDPTFGGPCFEGTLQKPTSVSESSPVAGTT